MGLAVARVIRTARREGRKEEGIRGIRVTPRNNEFQEIFTSGRENKEKITERSEDRDGGRGSPPESSSSVSFSSLGSVILNCIQKKVGTISLRDSTRTMCSSISRVSRARNAVSPPTQFRGNSTLEQCLPSGVHDLNLPHTGILIVNDHVQTCFIKSTPCSC